jgi:hypothetical protein
MQHKDNLFYQLQDCRDKVFSIRQGRNHKDLVKMLDHIGSLFSQLDQELVVCRRVNHYTVKYNQLFQIIIEQKSNLEKYLVLASLLE